MKNIILFCAAGMSTSLLVNKMRQAAAEEGFECDINAYPLNQIQTIGPTADAILLGPQVRQKLDTVRRDCPGIPSEVIDMFAYGTMDGKKVMAHVKHMLGL